MIGSTTTRAAGVVVVIRAMASAATATCSAEAKYPVITASSASNDPCASIPASTLANVSGETAAPPGAPCPGWRPNSTVGASTGSIPSRARANACALPPTRLAATKLERISTRGMARALYAARRSASSGARKAKRRRQRLDHPVHVSIGHRREERQREAARIPGLGARQIEVAVARAVVGLAMDRDVVDLGPDPLRLECGHHGGARGPRRLEIDQHGHQMQRRV